MDTVGKDIKHAWKLFRENKLFTATAIAALTLVSASTSKPPVSASIRLSVRS